MTAEACPAQNGRMTASALARFAALLADRTRAAFCLALLDDRAWTAGELAGHAGVAPATATGHLHKLVAAGLLTEHRQDRHRPSAGPRLGHPDRQRAGRPGHGDRCDGPDRPVRARRRVEFLITG